MATSFQDDLRELITNYVQLRQLLGTGDATTAELIVMACIMSDEPLPLAEVKSWVNRHSTKTLSNDLPTWLKNVKPGGFADHRVPICELVKQGSTRWTSPTAAANVFLRRRLFPYPPKFPQAPFRIMDLPPEIRASIFEFTLLLPRTGVWYDFQDSRIGDANQSGTLKVYAADRELGSSMSRYLPSHWNMYKDSPCQPSGDAKALFRVHIPRHTTLFRVSKQVYKEALPCFYSHNVFYLPNDWATLQFFRQLSAMQLHYFGNIVWRWPKNKKPARKLVRSLAALPRLRTLVIDTPPADALLWWEYEAGAGIGQARLGLDDVAQLTEITGLQDLTLFGAICEHEEFLRGRTIGCRT
jgi:hypothetical protein